MKLCAVLLLVLAGSALADTDSFFGEDKAKHFLVSACMTGMLSYAFALNQNLKVDKPLVAACSITLSMGVLKELRDRREKDNHFCFKDLLWDAIGVSAGAFTMRTLPSR
jgi:uncharacterized protein YfiM (DUF2279 family)